MTKSIEYVLRRGVSEIIVEEELLRLLESGKSLRLKMGFDPSRPDIHLGHVVGMRKLRQFQELGHQVVLIVGDWTAQIGDPSGTSQTRPMLTADEVRTNAETYMQQFFRVVDREKTELLWQSEWFGKFSLADVISLTSKFTVAQLLARDDFNKRHSSNKPIAVTELLYPLLQAYDSVVMEADVEFGGIDQKFNCLMGRDLQQMVGQNPQHVFLMPLLVGTDGQQKMSKSLDNYIAIEDAPNDMYGKVMSIPDSLMMDYFELITDVPDEELSEFRQQLSDGSVNPMELKKRLAREIVGQFHSGDDAREAESYFESVVQKKEIPEEIREISIQDLKGLSIKQQNKVSKKLEKGDELDNDEFEEGLFGEMTGTAKGLFTISLRLVLYELGLVSSKSEAKRLIDQRGIEVVHQDGSKIIVDDDRPLIRVGDAIKVGKRRWIKIVDKEA
ncbi:MAG: tyrosine--tRNA ligase [Dehalococcoidia bacterium]|nr:MAG: tyrosine--tRNA ligase [Dehalococcoidia bacterium]